LILGQFSCKWRRCGEKGVGGEGRREKRSGEEQRMKGGVERGGRREKMRRGMESETERGRGA
jgi:hypothetical protein